MMRKVVIISCLVATAIGFGFTIQNPSQNPIQNPQNTNTQHNSFFTRLADSAYTLTLQNVTYDPNYTVIPYPNGDVPKDKGVCTDVVIRAYRKLGIDLQKEVHQDMIKNFQLYPKNWGQKQPDKNIDHRRVPNLMTFFRRFGTTLKTSPETQLYKPGDIVCWKLTGGATHIGLVSNSLTFDGERYMIIHNIGSGQVLEDCLFSFPIIGHFRYSK